MSEFKNIYKKKHKHKKEDNFVVVCIVGRFGCKALYYYFGTAADC